MQIGLPPDLTLYKLLADQGGVIGGILALIAGILAFWIGRVQVRALQDQLREMRRAERRAALISVYRRLEAACDRPDGSHQFKELEGAFADLQLIGNREQLAAARAFMVSYTGKGSLHEVLAAVRQELRTEFNLNFDDAPTLLMRTG